jgi:glycosyltransferase involved in cell wall biosynthesis
LTVKLGLELTALETDHRTRGIGRVAQAYFEHLSQDDRVNLVPYTLGDFPTSQPNGSDDWTDQLIDPMRVGLFQRREQPDLLQVIDPMKVPSFGGGPVITMVHDLIPYLYRERYQTNLWSRFLHWRMKRQVRRSDFIITPSRCTADDLTMLFEVERDQIETIYHGIDHDRFFPRDPEVVDAVLERYDVERPYFLMVSDLRHYDPRKKLGDVIRGWDPDKMAEVDLVVLGKRGEYSDRLREEWTGAQSHLVCPGFVNDDELAAFYTGARSLLFPSRYEGFGFPVIESMACGTRPVVRGVGSVEEIAGDAAVVLGEDRYVDQLMDVLSSRLEGPPRDEECVTHAESFTWGSTIDQLIDCYQREGLSETTVAQGE